MKAEEGCFDAISRRVPNKEAPDSLRLGTGRVIKSKLGAIFCFFMHLQTAACRIRRGVLCQF